MVTLGVVVGLALTQVPISATDHDGGPFVECDADLIDDVDEEEEGVGYVIEVGQQLECTARGLADDVETGWHVDWEGMFGEGELGGVGLAVDGTFDFAIPFPDMPLWFEGLVSQGEEGADDRIELYFWGIVDWEPQPLDMLCEPDPVARGETVTCLVADAPAGEDYEWTVYLLDEHDAAGVDEDMVDPDAPVDPLEPSLSGPGTADQDGRATFGFEVPRDEPIVGYHAVADWLLSEAWFEGEVLPARDDPWPASPPPAATQRPTEIREPERVDAGAGGAACNGNTRGAGDVRGNGFVTPT